MLTELPSEGASPDCFQRRMMWRVRWKFKDKVQSVFRA